jgi:nucleoside-diphosphate-sugar epimerase
LIGEQYCQLFTRLYGLETVVTRYFNVFGPRQQPGSPYSGVISLFIEALAEGRAPKVHGDGKQMKRKRLAMHIQIQRVIDAAVEYVVEHEVHRGELWQQVPHDMTRLAIRKLLRDSLGRYLLNQQVVVTRVVRDQADIGAIALVAGARMRDFAQRHFYRFGCFHTKA